ncbi:MAG: zinc ribbon-containing protein [candidate division Zixibacteria bacterium]|nr:zinc ribbon-containing protein [candidate division Zixibacteria bacterium]
MSYKTGQKPGVGFYLCTRCGKRLFLDNIKDRIPPCPRCYNTSFRRITLLSRKLN